MTSQHNNAGHTHSVSSFNKVLFIFHVISRFVRFHFFFIFGTFNTLAQKYRRRRRDLGVLRLSWSHTRSRTKPGLVVTYIKSGIVFFCLLDEKGVVLPDEEWGGMEAGDRVQPRVVEYVFSAEPKPNFNLFISERFGYFNKVKVS
jgi:hypothetical protein